MGHFKPPKLLPAVLLAVTLAVTTASAFTDTGKHPARESIDRWSTQYQIINGYQDNTFRPDNNVTRGAFAGILNRVMHYVAKSPAGTFSDTRGNYWQDDILRLHAAGVYLGNNGRAQPADSITRQQAVVMIARAFRINGSSSPPRYSDADKISGYAKDQISEMQQKGWLQGIAGGSFQPAKPFTRGELVMLLDNMVSALIAFPQSFSQDVNGNVLISSQSGANLRDMEISGNLYIAPGVTGRVTLTDVEIGGSTVNFSSITPIATGTAPAITATVVFRVVNGSWNDGSSEEIVLSLGAREGGRLTLHASDIPAVGRRPADGYKSDGSWSVTPAEHDLKNGDREVYTFTYSAPQQYRASVTFKVVGGAWSSGASDDVVISLAGTSPDSLGLQNADIPHAGSAPAAGFLPQGSWSPSVPTAHALADGDHEVYTFTYAQPTRQSATVTFKVLHGSWNDGSSTDKTVTLTAESVGETLRLTDASIPSVGSRPAKGYGNQGTWSPSTPTAHTLADGANEVYTFTYDEVKSTAVSATVTFRVVNGAWNSGSTEDVVVRLTGSEGAPMPLEAGQIPSAGARPNSGFQTQGTWSPSIPEPHTLLNGGYELYTFTYTPQETIDATVTFKVINGMWNNGTSGDMVRRYSSTDINAVSLLASQIPSVGGRPSGGYKQEGTWSPSVPEPHPLANGANEVYTFTYTALRQIQANVTFKVVNGSWNSGSASDVTVQLTAQEGKALTLSSGQIPAVGSKPAAGYKAEGVWSPSTPVGHAVAEGTTEVYTFTYASQQAVNPLPADDPWAPPANNPTPSTPNPPKPVDPEDESGRSGSNSGGNTGSSGGSTGANTGATIKTNVAGVTLPVNPLAKPISSWPKNRKLQPSDIYTPSAKTGEYFTYGSRSIPVYARLQSNQTKPGDFKWNGRRLNYVGSRYKVTFGVDVSSYQGTSIDWTRAKNNGVQFAIIRAARRTYGVGAGALGKDSNYAANMRGAMNAGIMTGAYIFSTAITIEEAIADADYMISLLKGIKFNGPVAYDWEINASNYRNAGVSKEVATACAVAFCEKMLAEGYAPIVYISQYVGYVKYDMGALRTYLKWYPQYPATSNATPFPNFRYQVDMWQFSDSVTIPGIGSSIDSNLWFWPK